MLKVSSLILQVAGGRWQILLIDFAKQNFAYKFCKWQMLDFTCKFC
jgi:hypothetical protein